MSTKTAAPARRARTGLLAYLYSSMWVHRIDPAAPRAAAAGAARPAPVAQGHVLP